jgi:ABC-type phosphate transport system substrate-binding protein
LLGWLSLQGGPASAAETEGYKLIVNAANPTSTLSRERVSAMFLGKVTNWEHGGKVLPVDLPAVRSYWTQLVFSGRGVPLPEKASDAEVIAFVKSNPGAVGYVSLKAIVTEVKVVRVE